MRVAENPEPDAAEDRPIELEVKPATTRVSSKQLELQATLAKTHEDVNYLCKKKGQGLLGTEETVTLKTKQNKLDEMQQNLTKCKNNQTRQQRFRDNTKRKLENLDEDTRKKIKGETTPNDALEPNNLENRLHKTIIEIAIGGSAADERRRTDMIRTVHSLDDLYGGFENEGLSLVSKCGILAPSTA